MYPPDWPVSPSWDWIRSASWSGVSARKNGTHPADDSAALSAARRAAHHLPVSLSQMPQRPPNVASSDSNVQDPAN